MDKQAKQRTTLERLRTFPAEERVPFALELLRKERGIQLVSAALKALSPAAPPGTDASPAHPQIAAADQPGPGGAAFPDFHAQSAGSRVQAPFACAADR